VEWKVRWRIERKRGEEEDRRGEISRKESGGKAKGWKEMKKQ